VKAVRLARFIIAAAVLLAVSVLPTLALGHGYSPRAYPSRSHSSLYYTNVSGHRVHRPMFSAHPPHGWSAQCADGSYSFSEHHRGTCSHHGGVSRWH